MKDKPSAFHGTHLLDYLIYLGADTVITTGTTTSGCVRASAVDATQYNYRSIVPEECVWDRSMISHKVNLLDIQMKYGDVKKTDAVIDYFRARVEEAGGGNYQTLINDALVAYIQQRSMLDAVRQVVREELVLPKSKAGRGRQGAVAI